MNSTSPTSRPYAGAADSVPRGVQGGRSTADLDAEEVVVFLIGMRINRLRRVRSWLPVATAMPRMLRELAEHPADGLLHARSYVGGRDVMVVQYWRSAEQLGAFARSSERTHAPAWRAFNAAGRRGAAGGDVGIFHETFSIPADGVESVYANMPAYGLGRAVGTVPLHGSRLTRAGRRVGRPDPATVRD